MCTGAPLWAHVGSSFSTYYSVLPWPYRARVGCWCQGGAGTLEGGGLCVCSQLGLATPAEGKKTVGGSSLSVYWRSGSPWFGRGGSSNLLPAARTSQIVSRTPGPWGDRLPVLAPPCFNLRVRGLLSFRPPLLATTGFKPPWKYLRQNMPTFPNG